MTCLVRHTVNVVALLYVWYLISMISVWLLWPVVTLNLLLIGRLIPKPE